MRYAPPHPWRSSINHRENPRLVPRTSAASTTSTAAPASKLAVAAICEESSGFFSPATMTRADPFPAPAPRHRAPHLTISDRLQIEVCKSLRLGEPTCPEAEAQGRSRNFEHHPARARLLRTDVEAALTRPPPAANPRSSSPYPYIEPSPSSAAPTCLFATICLIPRMMTEWATIPHRHRHPSARHIHSPFFMTTAPVVVVGETSEIGKH